MKAVQTVDIPIGTGATSVTINLQANKWNRTDSGIAGIIMQCNVLCCYIINYMSCTTTNTNWFIGFILRFETSSLQHFHTLSNMGSVV